MGLLITAGLFMVVAIVFWIIYEVYCVFWAHLPHLICFGIAIVILFGCFLGCLCNHSPQNKEDLRNDYHILVLALEGADDPIDYYNLIPKVVKYNEIVEAQRQGRNNFWTNIIFSREIAEMPLVDLNECKAKIR